MFFEIFFGFFTNIFNIVIGIIFLLCGVIIGIVLWRVLTRPRNQIMYCRERDHRAVDLNIDVEDHLSLESHSDPARRFFKYGGSFELRKWGRSFTRFLGKEGTAFTYVLEGFNKVACKWKEVTQTVQTGVTKKGKPVFKNIKTKVPTEWETKKITLPFPSLEDAVKFRWGTEFYEAVPEEQQELLRNDKFLVTVGLEAGLTPANYPVITESTILDKADEEAAKLWGLGLKGAIQESFVKVIMILGSGVAIGWIANFFLTGI